MSERPGPIYEVTLSIDRDVARDVDTWLAGHIEEMLLIPGFTSANVFALADDERVHRVTHYHLTDDVSLEEYLAGPASTMRNATVEHFGDRFEARRRVLRGVHDAAQEIPPQQSCLNCDAPLTGQYCGNCGQRSRSRLISIWELLRDAFGDLLEIDSRVWQTLIPLAIRPGKLTHDYLRGQRARFMPPFRTYLVLSLLFFLVAFFDPQEQLGILFEPGTETSAEVTDNEQETRDEIIRELKEDGVLADVDDSSGGLRLSFDSDGDEHDCNVEDFDSTELPGWLGRRLTKERLQVMCERMVAEDGRGFSGFLDKLLENVPAGLFILLPLMALILNLLYPLSKRYYVEHLLFVVHYHAFIFLALTLQILYLRLAPLIRIPEVINGILMVAISIYIGIYLFKAMRRVYEQGRTVTALKFVLLLIAYTIGLALILSTAAIFAAFSI